MLTKATYAYAQGVLEKIRTEEKDRVPVLLINGLVVLHAEPTDEAGVTWVLNCVDELRPNVQQVLVGRFDAPLVVELRPKHQHKEVCGFDKVCLVRQAEEDKK
jgi:hypothetical protein